MVVFCFAFYHYLLFPEKPNNSTDYHPVKLKCWGKRVSEVSKTISISGPLSQHHEKEELKKKERKQMNDFIEWELQSNIVLFFLYSLIP